MISQFVEFNEDLKILDYSKDKAINQARHMTIKHLAVYDPQYNHLFNINPNICQTRLKSIHDHLSTCLFDTYSDGTAEKKQVLNEYDTFGKG